MYSEPAAECVPVCAVGCDAKNAIDEVMTRGFTALYQLSYGAARIAVAPVGLEPTTSGSLSMYSESAVDRVRLLLRFHRHSLSHLLPKRPTVGAVKPDELLLSRIQGNDFAAGELDVNKWQADGDDLVRLANGVGQVANPNGFIGR